RLPAQPRAARRSRGPAQRHKPLARDGEDLASGHRKGVPRRNGTGYPAWVHRTLGQDASNAAGYTLISGVSLSAASIATTSKRQGRLVTWWRARYSTA